jgi:hypothetical protein
MKSTQVFIMSYSKIINRSILLVLPFLFAGCYTQFQSLDDRFPVKDKEYSQYYEWDGHEEARVAQTSDSQDSTTAYSEQEIPLEGNNVYYINYEAKRWYDEHYANNLYWEGYDVGYEDGYTDGWRNLYPMSAQFSINRYRYYRGYTGAFEYYGFYRNPSYINFMWYNYGGFPYYTYFTGFYGQLGFYSPYYNGYWGHPYYAYNAYAYINHNWNSRDRKAEIYRKGPRSNGLINNSTDGRTRNGRLKNTNYGKRSRGSVIRTRSTNNTSRVRGTGSSRVGRGSSGSVGRSRGSAVGKTRGSSGSRSRGSGSRVNKRSSSSSNGTSRSRGRGSNLNYNSTSHDLGNLGSNGRTFTIPSRKVPIHTRTKTKRSRSRFSLGDLLFGPTNSTGNFRPSTSGSGIRGSHYTPKTRSSRSSVKRSSRSHSSKRKTVRSSVKRSSSSSKSTRSRSRSGSSSSSSKKRSRGNN